MRHVKNLVGQILFQRLNQRSVDFNFNIIRLYNMKNKVLRLITSYVEVCCLLYMCC